MIVVAGPIEGRGERALRERHAHRVREALAERVRWWSRCPEVHFALRMARRLRAKLAKILDLLDRQGVAGEVQHRIEQHRGVAVREHESVAVPPGRIARIELKHVAPEDFGDVRHAHGRARMARIGLLDGIHRQSTNGVGELAVGGHGGFFRRERAVILPDAPPIHQYRDTSLPLPERRFETRVLRAQLVRSIMCMGTRHISRGGVM